MTITSIGQFTATFTKLIAAGLTALALTSTQALALPVIDQQNTGPLTVGYCTGSCEWQQTITAGLTGQLTGITLYGGGSGQVRIGLGNGFYTGPWAADVLGAAINGTVIDLSSYNIFLTAGQNFVIDTWHISGYLQGTSTTPVGALFIKSGAFLSDYSSYGYGLGYTTYIDTAAGAEVPEPAALALFALGLFGFAAARRRKQ